MRIAEKQRVTRVEVTDVTIGRKCDCCGKDILPDSRNYNPTNPEYNYFLVTTYHHDWANDSCESYDYYDACSPECATKIASKYLTRVYEMHRHNTRTIEIKHISSLSSGSETDYEQVDYREDIE